MNFRILGLTVSLGLNAAACSPGPMPVSQSPKDPSNPTAEEGVPPLALLASATPPELGQGSRNNASADSGPASAVYTCPMHPDVTSSSPGRCAKCGMDLVPKK